MPRNFDSFAAEFFRTRQALGDGASRKERLWLRDALSSDSPDFDQLLEDQPDEAWGLIVALVERAPGEEDLAFVAAGPIEDLIRLRGRSFSGRIVAEARANPRFRAALNYTWGWNDLPDDVRAELLPLLDPEVRASWEAERAAATASSNKRWRPPQPRPKSERIK